MVDLDFKPISMAGSRIWYCDFGKALDNGTTFTELVGLEIIEAGDIENQVDTYRPFNNNRVYKYMNSQDYSDLIIKGAKIPASGTRTAFETSAARTMSDFTKNRAYKDLIVGVPVEGDTTFECRIYSGFFKTSNLDNIKQTEISRGAWGFGITNYKEASGTVSSNTLSLTARS